jgi:hypothetical protein
MISVLDFEFESEVEMQCILSLLSSSQRKARSYSIHKFSFQFKILR